MRQVQGTASILKFNVSNISNSTLSTALEIFDNTGSNPMAVYPGTDNAQQLGLSNKRWSEVFAGAVTASGLATAGKFAPTANTTAGNGMYLPTTNQVAIGTNGTEAIRVNASQNVGLKTTTPRSALDVNGDVHIVSAKIIQKTVTCTNATATNVITVTPGGATRSFAVEILVQANRTVSTRVSVVAKYLFTYIVGPVGNVQTKLNAILAPDFITQNTVLQNYASIAVTVETTSGDGRAVAINFTSGGSDSPFDTTARIFATVMGTNLSEVT
jgi:hypothetical protein